MPNLTCVPWNVNELNSRNEFHYNAVLTIGGNSPSARQCVRLRDDVQTDVITAFFFRSAI